MRQVAAGISSFAIIVASASGCGGSLQVSFLQSEHTAGEKPDSADNTRIPMTGSTSEPSYKAATHTLLARDDFDTYSSKEALLAAYPVRSNTDQFLSLISGRGGSGGALRLTYTAADVPNITIGPQFPNGPYSHVYFTSWFRASPQAFRYETGEYGIKGFMFFTSAGGGERYQYGVSNFRCDFGGAGPDQTVRSRQPRGISGWQANSCTGQDNVKTVDGEAPLWSDYADGAWHRVTFEIWTDDGGAHASGHKGLRQWLDGVLIYDGVDKVDPRNTITLYQNPINNIVVFGNAWGRLAADSIIDFDDWVAWTDRGVGPL